MATDPHAFWRAGLAGKPMQANEGNPQLGFYRRSRRLGPDDAVAYYLVGDQMHCARNGYQLEHNAGIELWTYCCDQPVEYKDYLHRIEQARWPNDNPVVLAAAGPTVGHNRPPADTSLASISSVLDALTPEASRILKAGVAKSQDEADQASDIANELMDCEKRAIAAHKVEKAPLVAAAKTIDRKWFQVRDQACDLKEQIRFRVITPFLTKVKRAAEQARQEALQRGEVPAEVRVAAGSLKRTTALRKVVDARINDYPAALAYFAQSSEVRETVQTLADRNIRAGLPVPGCERIEEERAV